jgi:hypothetical protein
VYKFIAEIPPPANSTSSCASPRLRPSMRGKQGVPGAGHGRLPRHAREVTPGLCRQAAHLAHGPSPASRRTQPARKRIGSAGSSPRSLTRTRLRTHALTQSPSSRATASRRASGASPSQRETTRDRTRTP